MGRHSEVGRATVLALWLAACGGDGTGPGSVAVGVVEVTPGSASILVGESRAFTATPKANGQALTGRATSWSSTKPGVASVSSEGTASAVRAGTTEIVATVEGVTGRSTLTVNNPVPAITTLSPASGVTGGAPFTLTVTGTGFMPEVTVYWNGSARLTTRVSATEVTATISAQDLGAAGSAQVTVLNESPGGGASNALAFPIIAPNPVPVASAIAPAQVNTGNNPLTLTVTGTGFTSASVVRWDGADRTTTFVSATELTAAVPGTDVVTARTVAVTVFNPAPGGGTSAPLTFTVHNPVPTLASISPAVTTSGGAAFTLTVNGTGYRTLSVVHWNGSARPTTLVSGAQLTAMIPASDIAAFGSADVTVFNPGPGGGTSVVRSIAINAPPSAGFLAIAAGDTHTCALTMTRQAWCWGEGSFLRAFTTTPPIAFSPIAVSGGQMFRQIAAGPYHSCALTLPGAAYCWGSDDHGQLGQGTMVDRPTPVAVSGGRTYSAIVTGGESVVHFHTYGFTCAIELAGKPWCWGTNGIGELGNGTNVDAAIPTAVSGTHVFTSIVAGDRHACGLTAAGAAWCWGLNMNGQLGDGTLTDRNVPVAAIGGHAFTSLSAADRVTCGLKNTGAVYCWGPVAGIHQHTPTAVAIGHSFAKLSTAANHTCGLTTGGAAWCWGSNLYGELGNGTIGLGGQAPVPVSGGHAFASISAGYLHTCAITTGGQTYCWGLGSDGALGNGLLTNRATPTLVAGGHVFASISASWNRACAVTTLGAAWCWGPGTDGQRGDGVSLNQLTPTVLASGGTYATISAGSYINAGPFNCATTAAGVASCWGSNAAGTLGDGSTTPSEAPVTVAGAIAFASVAAGTSHACGLTTVGAAYCWGSNYQGNLGTGTNINSTVPVAVGGGHTFRAISAGSWHTCGVTMAGAGYCWGGNAGGQLGTGNFVSSLLPAPVIGGHTFASISAARGENLFLPASTAGHTCAVTIGGQVYCWGDNSSGAVGAGTFNLITTPTLVAGNLTFGAVATGEVHTCGLSTAGAAYCWGTNLFGVLGAGPGASVTTQPVAVTGGRVYTSIAVGRFHTCALTAVGDAYCWGNGHRGRLGNGTVGDQHSPTRVSTSSPALRR